MRLAMALGVLGVVLTGCDPGVSVGAAAAADGGAAPQAACASPRQVRPLTEATFVAPTDAGMHALWDAEHFRDICSDAAWEKALLKNASIEQHIRAGHLVPVYVHSDGSPAIRIRVGSRQQPAALTADEARWVQARSEPYRYLSPGSVSVSGLEYVGGAAGAAVQAWGLARGEWRVQVYALAMPDDQRGPDGRFPPDFLITLNPAVGGEVYRTSVETFDTAL